MSEITPLPDMTPSRKASFIGKIYKGDDDTDNDCWIWIGNRTREHDPYFTVNRANRSARQIAYHMAVGAIPVGQHVVNTCNNPLCVNPEHLTLVPNISMYRRD